MKKKCTALEGCPRDAVARGWCKTHHEAWRLGRPFKPLQARPRSKAVTGAPSVAGRRYITLSEGTFKRLQEWASPLQDSAETAFIKVLDAAEKWREAQVETGP